MGKALPLSLFLLPSASPADERNFLQAVSMARSQPDFWQYASAAESSASQLSLWLSGISGSDDWVMEAMAVLMKDEEFGLIRSGAAPNGLFRAAGVRFVFALRGE